MTGNCDWACMHANSTSQREVFTMGLDARDITLRGNHHTLGSGQKGRDGISGAGMNGTIVIRNLKPLNFDRASERDVRASGPVCAVFRFHDACDRGVLKSGRCCNCCDSSRFGGRRSRCTGEGSKAATPWLGYRENINRKCQRCLLDWSQRDMQHFHDSWGGTVVASNRTNWRVYETRKT